MKLFWKVSTWLYCQLYYLGLNYKPQILFNNPNKKLECEITGNILADVNFNFHESKLILEALDALHYFSNGLINIRILFILNPSDKEQLQNNCVILKSNSEDEIIQRADQEFDNYILGLCQYHSNTIRHIFIVHDRLDKDSFFKLTVIHEMLHLLGLGHTEPPSTLAQYIQNGMNFPTLLDAREFRRAWQAEFEILEQDLRYFKIPID